MVTKIQKWGSGQGLRLSKGLLAQAGLDVGDTVHLEVRSGTLVVKPAHGVHGSRDLRQLVGRIKGAYRPGEIERGRPLGQEAW